jgi:hypothetical protein
MVPTDHPLIGCIAKYQRGQDHFDALGDVIQKRYGTNIQPTFTITHGVDLQDSEIYKWVIASVDAPPLEWATIVGDVVSNLRSSLDHLVYELSFLGTRGHPGNGTSFPCSLRKRDWNSKTTQQVKLEGVLPHHKKILYRAQPCFRRHDDAGTESFSLRYRHPLQVLQDLWNDDKHRMLQPVVTCTTNMDIRIVQTVDCTLKPGPPRWNPALFGRPLTVGLEIIAVGITPTGEEPDVNMQFVIDSEVALQDGVALMPRLANAATAVREILSWFAYEFETKEARQLWGVPRTGRVKAAPILRRSNLNFTPFKVQSEL